MLNADDCSVGAAKLSMMAALETLMVPAVVLVVSTLLTPSVLLAAFKVVAISVHKAADCVLPVLPSP